MFALQNFTVIVLTQLSSTQVVSIGRLVSQLVIIGVGDTNTTITETTSSLAEMTISLVETITTPVNSGRKNTIRAEMTTTLEKTTTTLIQTTMSIIATQTVYCTAYRRKCNTMLHTLSHKENVIPDFVK